MKKDRQSGDEVTRIGCSGTHFEDKTPTHFKTDFITKFGLPQKSACCTRTYADQKKLTNKLNAEVDEELYTLQENNMAMERGLFEGDWKWTEMGISMSVLPAGG